MHLSQDVVDRLLVAKGLLAKIRFVPTAHPDRISLAQTILSAHDAAELAIAAVAAHLGKFPEKEPFFLMRFFPEIEKAHPGEPVAGRPFFSQLNTARIAIKHKGVFPDPQQFYRAGETTYDYISEWCNRYFGFSFDELDESSLIRDEEVKEWYDKAKKALEQGQFKESLEFLAYATDVLFRSNPALRDLRIGEPEAKDAIKLAAFGVHANDYLALQEFLPSPYYKGYQGDQRVAKWKQKRYGHPGNWSKIAAEFSLKTFIDVALRIQDAGWIPGAIDFDQIYDHKITALEDGVEITKENKTVALIDVMNPKREIVKTLEKGESVRCYLEPKSPGDYLGALLGRKPTVYSIVIRDQGLFGEVDADKVHVTCVPKDDDLIRKYFSHLPEVDYEP